MVIVSFEKGKDKTKRRRIRTQITFDPDLHRSLKRLQKDRHETFSGTIEHMLRFMVTLANLGMPLHKEGALSWLRGLKEIKVTNGIQKQQFSSLSNKVRVKPGD